MAENWLEMVINWLFLSVANFGQHPLLANKNSRPTRIQKFEYASGQKDLEPEKTRFSSSSSKILRIFKHSYLKCYQTMCPDRPQVHGWLEFCREYSALRLRKMLSHFWREVSGRSFRFRLNRHRYFQNHQRVLFLNAYFHGLPVNLKWDGIVKEKPFVIWNDNYVGTLLETIHFSQGLLF